MTTTTSPKRSDRMRAYEDAWRQILPQRSYAILRVDGRAFHTLTRPLERPFDTGFMSSMNFAAATLCQQVQGAVFGFVQSDEISVLITAFESMQELWFGGVVQKMTSIAAAVTSNAFNMDASDVQLPLKGRLGAFDARVFAVPTREEVINYFLWRQADCHRNAVSMIADEHFSHKQLHGKTIGERIVMLQQRGVELEQFPQGARRGRVAVKVAAEEVVSYTRKDTGEERSELVTRYHWRTHAAPWFDWDEAGFLEQHVPHRPDPGDTDAY